MVLWSHRSPLVSWWRSRCEGIPAYRCARVYHDALPYWTSLERRSLHSLEAEYLFWRHLGQPPAQKSMKWHYVTDSLQHLLLGMVFAVVFSSPGHVLSVFMFAQPCNALAHAGSISLFGRLARFSEGNGPSMWQWVSCCTLPWQECTSEIIAMIVYLWKACHIVPRRHKWW